MYNITHTHFLEKLGLAPEDPKLGGFFIPLCPGGFMLIGVGC
jgi:hypothetical protein